MPDIVDSETRSRMMAGIRSTNTGPELLIRRALHKKGFRYRLHPRRVPGKPDLVLSKYSAAIFVHGCFWHGHDCALFRLPETRREFWEQKISRNRQRDSEVAARLRQVGWRSLTVWECATRGPGRLEPAELVSEIARWIRSADGEYQLRGRP